MSHRVDDVVAIACGPGESLLSALERQGHRVEYQCRQGYCGACRLPLADAPKQTLSYLRPPLAWHGADEVLTCCTHASSPIRLKLI